MIYLLSAIIFGSLFSIAFKVCQNMRIDCSQVIMFNYLTAAVAALIPIGIRLLTGSAEPQGYVLHGSSWIFALAQGAMFAVGFTIMDHSVWRSGVALTTVASKAALILPVVLSWLLLSQPEPDWLPVVAILVSLAFIILPVQTVQHTDVQLTDKTDRQRSRIALLLLIAVFFWFGFSDFGIKVSQNSVAMHLSSGEDADSHLDMLMGVIFLSATVVSLAVCLITGSFRKNGISMKSLAGGVALGVANILCTASQLRAMSTLSTDLYYPVYNIGVVVVGTVTGIFLFREKVKWVQLLGIAMALVAINLFFR